jgi:hypothetical protein
MNSILSRSTFGMIIVDAEIGFTITRSDTMYHCCQSLRRIVKIEIRATPIEVKLRQKPTILTTKSRITILGEPQTPQNYQGDQT